MVDVGAKAQTARQGRGQRARRGTAPGSRPPSLSGDRPKGDVLAVARVAGILAAKRTPELIPLCHAVAHDEGHRELRLPAGVAARSASPPTVEAVDRTGVEMEALVAASVAALTVYDMIKGIDRWATIEDVRLEAKSRRQERRRAAPPATRAVDEPGWRCAMSALGRRGRGRRPAARARGGSASSSAMVRDHNDGRTVVKLEYEAYAAMALAEMKRIASRSRTRSRACASRRASHGRAPAVGDLAVVCAASAPHRGEAFRACRALIDRVKARVPIWKREHGPDGAYWVGWEDARCGEEHEGHEHGH